MGRLVGFESVFRIENAQVIDSKNSTLISFCAFAGLVVQNRVQWAVWKV